MGKSIKVTKLGEVVVRILEKYAPKIISEELTRKFEEEMELVYQGKKRREDVVEEAKKVLRKILEDFKKNEGKIGRDLAKALAEARMEERIVGKCKCGGDLIIIKRKGGKAFVGCTSYPNCKLIYPLPRNSKITPTGKICEKCGTPIVEVRRRGKRPFRMCLDPNCETKKSWKKKSS